MDFDQNKNSRPEVPADSHEPAKPADAHTESAEAPAAPYVPAFAETPKEKLLSDVKAGLHDGTITVEDIRTLVPPETTSAPLAQVSSPTVTKPTNNPVKLSAVEIMFHIAGIVLFAALMTFLGNAWNSLNSLTRILMSLGIGLLLWAIGYIFNHQQSSSDIRKGLENSIIVTGTLCVLVGGFIVTYTIVGTANQDNLTPIALTLLLLGAAHILYDRLVTKDLTILFGVLVCVAAVPTYIIGLLASYHGAPATAYSLVMIASAGLLVYASRVVSKIYPTRTVLSHPFDTLGIFITLATMFFSIFTNYGVVWTLILFMSIFGLFYLSIIKRNKEFLGNASFFLIVGVITVAFKYFSGFGVSISLVIAAIGLLASAAFAASINRKYFKNAPAPNSVSDGHTGPIAQV